MNFFINDTNIAKQYIDELFAGRTKIASFCSVYDCSKCLSTTKLYARVLSYHNSELVQKLFETISQTYTQKLLQRALV